MAKVTASPVSRSIPFDILNLSFKQQNVQDVFEEIRRNTVFHPVTYSSVLNTTQDLDDTSLVFVNGSALNFKVRLPDATTLFNGQNYIIANKSSASISVLNNTGTSIFELLADSIAVIYLRSNSTSAGLWDGFVVSGFATGILSYRISSSVDFTTSAAADTLITGFSVTPVAGQYGAWYSSSIQIATNNRLARCVIYSGDVANENTRRVIQGTSSNFNSSHQTLGLISVNGSQQVDVRVSSSGGNLITSNRSLLLIRLGPEE